jgi:hypothetical protein
MRRGQNMHSMACLQILPRVASRSARSILPDGYLPAPEEEAQVRWGFPRRAHVAAGGARPS